MLLQVLDDGRLTDSKGRTVDFKNTVLIMTSNVGAQALTSAWAQGEDGFEDAKVRVMESLRQQFRPSFSTASMTSSSSIRWLKISLRTSSTCA